MNPGKGTHPGLRQALTPEAAPWIGGENLAGVALSFELTRQLEVMEHTIGGLEDVHEKRSG